MVVTPDPLLVTVMFRAVPMPLPASSSAVLPEPVEASFSVMAVGRALPVVARRVPELTVVPR